VRSRTSALRSSTKFACRGSREFCRSRAETPKKYLAGGGSRGVPRHPKHTGARLLDGADQLPASALSLVDDPSQEHQLRVLICGQPDAFVVVVFFWVRARVCVPSLGRRRRHAFRTSSSRSGEWFGAHGALSFLFCEQRLAGGCQGGLDRPAEVLQWGGPGHNTRWTQSGPGLW
jgi:hypothetical protein